MSTPPSQPTFVHLRLHSEYSVTDGLTRIDEAIAQAVTDGQPALAITDLANLFGMVKFYTAARGKGIKPIIGCDVWIGDDDAADKQESPARLLLLVKNRGGYLRLCELLSAAYLAPRRHGRAEITRSQLSGGDNSGLIALSGGPLGDIGQMLAAGKLDQADVRAQAWARMFPASYYVEVQRPSGADDAAAAEVLVAASADLAARLGQDGLPRLLPDRRRLHPKLGQGARRDPGGPGPRLGRRLAGGLCARITDLDPLRYDLLFERFLNPERVSMPDFDIDFCQEAATEVIDYVAGEIRPRCASRRSSPSAPWRPRPSCATSGACSASATGFVDKIAKLCPTSSASRSAGAREGTPDSARRREPTKRSPNCWPWRSSSKA
jgi:DNA polymerase III alpha subunit